jgi:hypothetical protein
MYVVFTGIHIQKTSPHNRRNVGPVTYRVVVHADSWLAAADDATASSPLPMLMQVVLPGNGMRQQQGSTFSCISEFFVGPHSQQTILTSQ